MKRSRSALLTVMAIGLLAGLMFVAPGSMGIGGQAPVAAVDLPTEPIGKPTATPTPTPKPTKAPSGPVLPRPTIRPPGQVEEDPAATQQPVRPPDHPRASIEPVLPAAGLPTAAFFWKAQPRVSLGWEGYDQLASAYPGSYAKARFAVSLDGCGSSGNGLRIESYRWRVRSPTGGSVALETVQGCEATFVARSEGRYRVQLRIGTSGGSDQLTKTMSVDDTLILVLGDSMASGEGNSPWVDERCHRSTRSGLSRAADRLEARSDHSSVTLVNLSCSGAEVDSGLLEPYAGIHPPLAAPPLPAQIEAARRWLCGGVTCRPDARHVDAIFLSIGINDLSFSDIAVACANPLNGSCLDDSALQQGIEKGLTQISTGLDAFAAQLTGPFAGTEVYLMQYPDDPFDSERGGHGCGVLRRIDKREAAWMHSVGVRLDSNLKGMALRNRFYPVEGVAKAFRGHGYCASNSYFRGVVRSFLTQHNKDGTLHPNLGGHYALAERILAAWDAPKVERRQLGTAFVTFQRVTVRDDAALGSDGAALSEIPSTLVIRGVATQEGYWMRGGVASWIDRLVPNGEALPLTGDEFTVAIPIWNLEDLHVTASTCLRSGLTGIQSQLLAMPDPYGPLGRLPIDGAGDVIMDPGTEGLPTGSLRCLKASADHRSKMRWGAGTHTITDEISDGSLTVTYRVRFVPDIRPDRPLPSDAPVVVGP